MLTGQHVYFFCMEMSFNKRAKCWGIRWVRTLSGVPSPNRDRGGMLMAAGAFPALPTSPFDLRSSVDALNLGKS